MVAPAGTPAPILERLEKEARAAIKSPPLKARFEAFGLEPVGSTAEEFRRDFEAAAPVVERMIKASGAKLD